MVCTSEVTKSSPSSQRCFSYLKLTLLLTVALKYEILGQSDSYRKNFERELNFCTECFQSQIKNCEQFFGLIEYDSAPSPWQSIVNLLPQRGKRVTDFLKFKSHNNSPKIISKSHTKVSLETPKDIRGLKSTFFNPERFDGFQFCPEKNIKRIVEYLQQQTEHTAFSIWLHMVLDVEPFLMPLLEKFQFPVPKTFAVCGFTLYQQYVGRPLIYYYSAPFAQKLLIAKQLLQGAIQFSEGFAGFRIYITDLNPDNVVFDDKSEQLYFVDLDSVLIVDSEAKNLKSMHKHYYIECTDCFAYAQHDICAHKMSDLNLYSACQILREDLKRNRELGFLHPIPEEIQKSYPQLHQILDACVDCVDGKCVSRLAATKDLIAIFDVILKKFY